MIETKDTIIVGIESSCDETACAVVANGSRVMSNVVATQIDMHARFGGVVPEIASRAHIEAVNTVIREALDTANITSNDVSSVAVTHQPGLIGSLLVGLMAAKTLSWVWDVPIIGVNHVYAHAYAAALDSQPIEYPAVALICSGGHTALYHCDAPTEMQLLGSTIDDAAGEAFDKVASILGLSYPGGPIIDKTARDGNPAAVAFPRTLLKGQSLDFSFSGLKTAVLYHINGIPGMKSTGAPDEAPRGIENFTPQQIADVAASFQAAVVDVLTIKIRRGVQQTGAKTIILGGGVAANSALRDGAEKLAAKLSAQLRTAPLKYCTDNAAMIAGLGYHYLAKNQISDLTLKATPTVHM
ncbi:MAG: tRNA (adenosine(37)-N6)-threonylcarbamoyltransferase complex transferase subunit TsaD [Phycisphaerae bacterium]|nr:tRNA (adenosine(37)-N6)-threonylcarbamoyltransferase complex transferase subunit TsaD [Phycisphaerae bacterium]